MSCHRPIGGYPEPAAGGMLHPVKQHPTARASSAGKIADSAPGTAGVSGITGKGDWRLPGLPLRAVLITLALLVQFAALGSSAAELQKFRDWDRTPEAAFMTARERTEWKKIRTDAAAEKFIGDYRARRGTHFPRELERRIEMADLYLTSGSTPGSRTLRGKVMILCGPPTRIERSGGTTVGQPENPALAGIYTNVGPMGSRSTHHRVTPVVFTLRYSGSEVKERLGREELLVRIEIDPSSGVERFADERMAKEFESLADQVAEWSVVPLEDGAIRIADFH